MNSGRLARLRAQIKPRWDEDRTARVRAALVRRSRRWRLARVGLVAALTLGSLAAAVGLSVHAREKERRREELAQTTTATPLGPDSVLMPDPDGAGRAFVLKNGAARFVVAHDAAHPFRVRAGAVIVEDVGTTFTVRLVSQSIVEVAVEEGRARVVDPGHTSELGPGERRMFDAEVPFREAPVDSVAVSSGPLAPEAPVSQLSPRPVSVPPWRPLAEGGQYREAFESLRRAGRDAVRDDVGELLLAADAARLSDHPVDAVPYLQQVAHSHGHDPRVGLAYFTLGRVLLDELGRPAEAASAFENARRGELAEDALAREVEACSRAGDTIRAGSLALEYERLYPRGRRARAVAKFGGLE